MKDCFDIFPPLKREDSPGTAPLGWDIVVYDVTALLNPPTAAGSVD